MSIELEKGLVDFFRYIFWWNFDSKCNKPFIPPFPLTQSRLIIRGQGWGEEEGYEVRCFHPFTTLLSNTTNQKLPMKILNKIRSNSVSQYPRASSLHDSLYSNQLRTFMERRTNKHAFERRLVGISLRKTIE